MRHKTRLSDRQHPCTRRAGPSPSTDVALVRIVPFAWTSVTSAFPADPACDAAVTVADEAAVRLSSAFDPVGVERLSDGSDGVLGSVDQSEH